MTTPTSSPCITIRGGTAPTNQSAKPQPRTQGRQGQRAPPPPWTGASRYYLLLSPALAASGVPLPLLDWARRHRLPHFTPLPPTAHQQPHQQQEPGPGLAPAAGEPVLGMSYSGSSSRAGSATHGDSEEVRQRELLLPQLPAGAGDALAECRLEESSSLWVLSASAANGGASVARVPQPHSPVCSGTQGGSCCAGSSGAASGAALTPLVLPLPRLPRRARRVVCNVTVPEGTAATLSGLPVQGPSACQWNATQRQGHVFSFVVFEELDTFSRSLMSADGVIAAATGSSSGSGSGSAGWLRSTAYGSGHGAGGRGDSSRRAAYAAAAGVFGRSAGTMSGWMRGGFHIGGGVLAGAWLPATAAAPAATADAGAHDSGGPTGRADAERYWQQERDQARRADQQHQPPPQPPPSVAGFVARGLAALRAVLSGLDGSTLYYCSSYLCDSTLYKPRKIASDVSDGRGEGIGRASVFWAVQGGLLALLLPLLRMVDSLLGLDWRALGSMAVAGWRLAAALGGPLLLPHLAVLRLLLPHTELWQVDVMMVTAAGLICSYAECLLATRLLLRWRADVEDAAGVRLDTPTANIIWRRVCQEASGPRLFCWRRMLAWRGPLDGALVCAAVYQYSCSRAGAGLDPVLRLLLPLLCRWEQAKSLMAQAMYSRLSAVEVATRASKQFIQVASTARLLHDSVEPLTLTQMAAVLEPHNRELWRLLAADDGREAALPLTAAQHVLMAMQRHRNGGRDRPQGQGQRELQLRERDRERERLRRRQEAAAGSEEGGSGATQPAADVKWPPPIKVPDGPGVTAGAGSGGGDVIAPRAFLCPITHDVMTQPCLLISPQLLSAPTYERSAIQTWLTLRQTDPRTNTTLITWILLPNDELFRCIDDWARGLEVVAVEATEAAAAPIDAAAEQCAQYGSSPTDG